VVPVSGVIGVIGNGLIGVVGVIGNGLIGVRVVGDGGGIMFP
jgi:hypothetical protein